MSGGFSGASSDIVTVLKIILCCGFATKMGEMPPFWVVFPSFFFFSSFSILLSSSSGQPQVFFFLLSLQGGPASIGLLRPP